MFSTPITGFAPRSAARADAACKEKANNGFEITGNFFEYIRDNAVEPEDHAAFWIVKHNAFVNSYAVISTDGVSGNDLLVFGNLCSSGDTWLELPRSRLAGEPAVSLESRRRSLEHRNGGGRRRELRQPPHGNGDEARPQ
jgi:hypothetical protein